MKKYFPTHLPVLKNEIVEYLGVEKNKDFVDCTLGEGGHTLAILEKNAPLGKVIALEINPRLFKETKERMKEEIKSGRLILVNDSYVNLDKVLRKIKGVRVWGILFDLGLSSWHLEKSDRGFSFQKEEPLIMRYDEKKGLTAQTIVNEWEENKIEEILKKYGQERFARKIAREIVERRKIKAIETTKDLVEIIGKAVPSWYKKKKIHFATKTFQALRIAVNDELENLKIGLLKSLKILRKNGRLAVISFHSLEDKIVKDFFKTKEREGTVIVLTRKPITPTKEEIEINPRSRSAKLRVAIKIK